MNHSIRILYVDDYPLDRELVRDTLEKEADGFHVTEATSRAEFEARLEDEYDLVLSDFNILGFEGLQVLDAVHARHPGVPVVIVTGTGSEEIAVQALKRGAADYVIKTTKHIQRLPQTIYAVIEKQRSNEERAQHGRELEAIANVSMALRIAQTRGEMLPILLDQLLILLHAEGAAFEKVDPVTGEVVAELGRGIWAAVTGEHFPSSQGLTAQVIATHQYYLNNDVRRDPRLLHPDLIGDCNAVAGVPLVVPAGITGLLWVARKTELAEDDVRLLTAIADITSTAIHRATLYEQTARQVERFAALHAIDRAISSSFDLRVTLNILLEQVTTQLRVDAAAVLLLNPHLNTLEFAAGRGFREGGLPRASLRFGEDYASKAALERRRLSIPNLRETGRLFALPRPAAGEDFTTYHVVPLIAKGQVKGVLEVFHRVPFNPGPDWLEFLDILAGQTAIAIDNSELFNRFQRANSELMMSYDATLEGWSRALDLRDKETEGHTQRVVDLTLHLAKAMGLGETELVHVRRGALLHDIGKMGISDTILLKPSALTDAEWVLMRRHPEYAYELLSPITYLRPALDIPYCHHEKWDGTGYPRGLKGDQIPLAARIFAVVDVWDALRSDRPYRKAWSADQVRNHIRSLVGTHFDPRAVEMFFSLDK